MPFLRFTARSFAKDFGLFSFQEKELTKCTLLIPPALNSMEAIMKKLPYGTQKGGGRYRSPYKYTKENCDCRFCLSYRKETGCTLTLCPVLDARLSCGAAPIGEAVKAVFKDVQNTAFQKRLSQIYHRKDDADMIFQNNRHRQIFEAERLNLRKPGKKALAVLYLLTADHTLWIKTKHLFTPNGKVDLKSVRLGNVSTDSYALSDRRETNIAVRAGGQRHRIRQRFPSDCAGSSYRPLWYCSLK